MYVMSYEMFSEENLSQAEQETTAKYYYKIF